MRSQLWPQVSILVEELKSHKLSNAAKKRKKNRKNSLNGACGETEMQAKWQLTVR